MSDHAFSYVETTIPAGMTVAEYRRHRAPLRAAARPQRMPRRLNRIAWPAFSRVTKWGPVAISSP